MNKYLWKFHWDCGRQGDVNGLFVATEEEVKAAIGQEVYFGEILGKHSEVYGTVDEGEIVKVDIDSDAVAKVAAHLGDDWSGYNPLNYLRYDCDKCGDRYSGYDMEETGERNICYSCKDE